MISDKIESENSDTNRKLSTQEDENMKEQLKRRLLILMAALGVVIVFFTIFNHASFDPNFSFKR